MPDNEGVLYFTEESGVISDGWFIGDEVVFGTIMRVRVSFDGNMRFKFCVLICEGRFMLDT